MKIEIEKFLREVGGEDGPLGKLNNKFRHDLLADQTNPASRQEGVERFAKLINSTLAGAIFSSVGKNHAGLTGTRKVQSLGAPNKKAGRKSEIALQPIPDWLEVRKSSVQQGESEYITVRTNAVDDFGDALSMSLPDFLTAVECTNDFELIHPTIALKNGRASYYVKCDPETPVGTLGSITVTLDRARLSLPTLQDSVHVMVVKRERTQSRQKTANQEGADASGLPDLIVQMVRPSELSWSAIQAGGLDPEGVAYFSVPNEAAGIVDIYVNAEFPALTHIANEAQKRFKDSSVVEALRDDYQFAIRLAVLAALESKIDEMMGEDGSSTTKLHKINAANARVFAMTAWERMEGSLRSTLAKGIAA